MNGDERFYRMLLRVYPSAFRLTFGREMVLLFRDTRRDDGRSSLHFWARLLWDVACSAPRLRIESLRAAWTNDTYIREGTMRPMAMLAILIGAFEAFGAAAEGFAGGKVGDNLSLAVGGLGVLGGALLIAAGITLLRRSPAGAGWARNAAIGCLAAFIAAALMGRLSIAAMALGVVFPIVLLLFLFASRGRGPAVT